MALAEFDQIADVYDDTRRALDHETLKGIREMLTKHGCHSILEIGVGTGRIGIPLLRSGFEVAGADISRKMMEKARAKGMENLFLADGGKAPFAPKSFDATLMAHVFHLLEDPMSVMAEAARISRVGVLALLRKRSGARGPWFWFYDGYNSLPSDDDVTRKFLEERRERFRKIFAKYGWNSDRSRRLRNWRREEEILETCPPDDLKVVSDVVVNDTLEERIARFEKGGYSFVSRMPDEMRREIINEMRAYASSAIAQGVMQPRHEIYRVALWDSKRLLGTKPVQILP